MVVFACSKSSIARVGAHAKKIRNRKNSTSCKHLELAIKNVPEVPAVIWHFCVVLYFCGFFVVMSWGVLSDDGAHVAGLYTL